MRIEIDLQGVNDLIRQLTDLGEDAQEVVLDAVEDMALATHQYAQQGILRGPKTGRVYEKYKPRRTHQASSPGEYPATDTGRLAGAVAFELPRGETAIATVGTNLQYGRHLEFGTSRMAARPWLLPSFEKAKADVIGTLRKRLEAKL